MTINEYAKKSKGNSDKDESEIGNDGKTTVNSDKPDDRIIESQGQI